MKRLFQFLVMGFVAIAIAIPGWAYDEQESISVTITIDAETDLTVSYLDASSGGPGTGGPTGTGGLDFSTSSLDLSDGSTYWAVSSDCLLVEYSSNYAWGLRIVTDNYVVVTDAISDAGESAIDINGDGSTDIQDYVNPSRLDLDSDGTYDDYSYGGLLSLEDINEVIDAGGTVIPEDDQDPSKRAVWAWLAEDAHTAGYTASLPTATQSSMGTGYVIVDSNVGYCWTYADHEAWAYIVDKSDDGFSEDIYEDYDSDGDEDDLTYSIVATGMPGTSGSLVPFTHTVTDSDSDGNTDMPDLADNDLVIYIAARFANTNFADLTEPVPYVLTPDTYKANLYLELIHE